MEIQQPEDFPFFHPPAAGSVRKALGRLILFGAINRDRSLTPDGEQMAELPVSLRSARLLVEGLKAGERIAIRRVSGLKAMATGVGRE